MGKQIPKTTALNDTFVTTRVSSFGRTYSTTRSLKTGLYTNQITIDRQKEASSFFKVIFMALFLVMFIQIVASSGQGLSFRYFLEVLTGAPNIPLGWLYNVKNAMYLGGDWGIFDFIRAFINSLSGIIVGSLYILTGVAQVFSYAVYFVTIIFGMQY